VASIRLIWLDAFGGILMMDARPETTRNAQPPTPNVSMETVRVDTLSVWTLKQLAYVSGGNY
jgi:hypothetical protein